MQTSVDIIVKNLFKKNNLSELPEEQLEEYISSHPYASVGYLLLAKKRKQEGKDFKQVASSAALFLNNPLWLHNFLSEGSTETSNAPASINKYVAQPEINIEHSTTETEEQPLPEHGVDVIAEPQTESVPEKHPNIVEENIEQVAEPSIVEQKPAAAVETVKQETESESPSAQQNIITPVSEKVVDEEALVFEPYHTIDYFASQGIKLSADDLTKDKFGRQLKSFTEWLRSMKRVAPVQTDDVPNQPLNEMVQKTAEASVVNNDVETEAMAEVWAKQGKVAKAIEIYQKLSLLNPSKSHYFAAKIEQLNA